MRKGKNIHRDTKITKSNIKHRVVFPVFIPYEKAYYAEAFAIFKTALLSVHKTASFPIVVSVISNGSSKTVNDKLYGLYKEGYINELIIETDCLGKINSLLKVLRTIQEPMVTVADADVLFLNGWDHEVFKLFKAFPKAGAVSPVPVFRKHFELTANIWLRYLFSDKLKFTAVQDPEAMTKFANSIGWPWLDKKFKDVYATLKTKNGTMAMVGGTHFVATYKSEVFKYLPKENSNYYQGGDSERLYTDQPVVKAGGFRLSTAKNYAYHMGNVYEDWMQETFEALKPSDKENHLPTFAKLKPPVFNPLLLELLFKKLLRFPQFKYWVLRKKGLSKEQLKNFL